MKVPFVDLGWQEAYIRTRRETRFADVIERSAFVLGPEVDAFEKSFAAYCGSSEAVGVANGTDALALIYTALGIGRGDEIVTIPTTFIASISPFIHLGATPVFVDIDEQTRNFDISRLKVAITSRTKAILVVHLYGDIPDMDAILAVAKEYNVPVIEDACQAHGAAYKGKRAGSFGVAAAFSFYPGKNLGAYGDAGAITTNDHALAEKIRKLRNHGGVRKYEHACLGFNSRLDTLQAVVLDEKLKFLDAWNTMRREIARQYRDGLFDIASMRLPNPSADVEPVYHLYVVEVLKGSRDAFMAALKEKGVSTGVHYPDPLHRTPALSVQEYGPFPVAEGYASRIVSLPMYPGMTEEQVAFVVATIRHFFHE
jgi:dTDP-4-amino-4,6-dideoxygalactose transaminase